MRAPGRGGGGIGPTIAFAAANFALFSASATSRDLRILAPIVASALLGNVTFRNCKSANSGSCNAIRVIKCLLLISSSTILRKLQRLCSLFDGKPD